MKVKLIYKRVEVQLKGKVIGHIEQSAGSFIAWLHRSQHRIDFANAYKSIDEATKALIKFHREMLRGEFF